MTDRLDLDAIRARTEAATPGPWKVEHPGPEDAIVRHEGDGIVYLIGTARRADSEFIAHARTDVPALLDEIRVARAVLRRVVSITQDTDGDSLGIDDEIPVGEVLRMLFEFDEHAAAVNAALAGGEAR